MSILIGRQREQQQLLRLSRTERSEFLAVYGRRRVGKTYLIRETFHNEFSFSHTGLAPVNEEDTNEIYTLQDQLRHFFRSLQRYGYQGKRSPKNWLDAFYMLEDLLEGKYKGERMTIFIDELPWMDVRKSHLVRAIDAFWNSWCNGRNVLLIVCGSAASWMLDNVINQHGGLYGRVTAEMKLAPFTLAETEQYFHLMGAQMSRYDVAQAYMAIGGIPFYMNFWQADMSLAQNMDYLFFDPNAKLRKEFNRLFRSLFTHPDLFVRIIRLLGKRHRGYNRKEICEEIGVDSGQTLTKTLEALQASDFIQYYQPFGKGKRDQRYRLVDPYCLFYLHFMESDTITDAHYWTNNYLGSTLSAWRGIAFEEVCLLHISAIKRALGIEGIASDESSWIYRGDKNEDGAQIDLIISRADNVVNLCEMKFYKDDYLPTKEDDVNLRHRITALSQHLNKRQSMHVTLVTAFGLSQGMYSGMFTNTITLDDLFKE